MTEQLAELVKPGNHLHETAVGLKLRTRGYSLLPFEKRPEYLFGSGWKGVIS